jgi:hypothetical protein
VYTAKPANSSLHTSKSYKGSCLSAGAVSEAAGEAAGTPRGERSSESDRGIVTPAGVVCELCSRREDLLLAME